MPAGNRDGGQWTDGSEVGGETSSNRSDNGASDAPNLPIRYAQASTDTATDAASGGGNAAVTTLEDTQHDLSNLYHALVTAGHTVLGLAAQHFLNSHDFDIKRIDANALPADHPRAPVPFVDSNNEQIYDADGKPLLRPLGLPPELYAQAGNAVRSWVDDFNRDIFNVTENPETLMAMAVKILAPLAPGGPLDAERFDWTYVRDYRHYQNIMIGVYGAAAGMNKEDVLSFIDLYAWPLSIFRQKETMDPVYTHSAKQDVEDTKSGYELYRAGRVRLGR